MLSDYQNKESVTILGVVESIAEREAKNKNPYVQITLTCDGKTARCFKWNTNLKDVGVNNKDIVQISGEINVFGDNNAKSLKIDKIVVIDEPSQELLKRILPSLSEEDQRLYTDQLRDLINQINDKGYKSLVNAFFVKYKDEFFKSPAARKNHDAFVGGLLKHTVSVTQVALKISDVYGGAIDRDLIIAGAILHDIGKIRTYSVEMTGIDYSTESALLDHVIFSMEMIDSIAQNCKIDAEQLMLVKHIIASHHGQKEWGAINEPSTPEALIVHLADMADCFVTLMQDELADVMPGCRTEGNVWPLGRKLYRRSERDGDA
jgi:3'-5' exoribonuclease